MKRIMVGAVLAVAVLGACTKLEEADVQRIASAVWSKKPAEQKPPSRTLPGTLDGEDSSKLRADLIQAQREVEERGRELAGRDFVESARETAADISIGNNARLVEVAYKVGDESQAAERRFVLGYGAARVLDLVHGSLLAPRETPPRWSRWYPQSETVFSDARDMAQAVIRSAIVEYAQDRKRLEALWAVVRPALRRDYALLHTLRGNEALLKTPYSAAAFAPVKECLEWHHALTYSSSEPQASTPHRESKRCNALYKRWGIQAEFGSVGAGEPETAWRNARWVIGFYERRVAEGGEKFARELQRLARDFIKPQ